MSAPSQDGGEDTKRAKAQSFFKKQKDKAMELSREYIVKHQ